MLPKGWSITTVADACDTVSVGIVINPSSYYVDIGGIRTFRSGNVRENQVNDANWAFISKEGHKKNKKSTLKAGDVLIVRTGFAGTACVVPIEYDGSNCIDILFARPKKNLLLPEYLCQLTNSELGRKQVLAGQNGLAQKHLNASSYKKMRFAMPPVIEQASIVSTLLIWDKAITLTGRLLTTIHKHKLAILSQLMTGKRRLRQFNTDHSPRPTPHGLIPGDWRYPKIEEFASELSLKHTSGKSFPVLSCTKHDGLVDSLSYFKKQVFSKDLSTYKVVPRGTFVYATNHIEEGSIGYQGLYDFGLVSPMYTVFKTTDKVNDGYLYRLLKTEHFRQIFEAATNSSVDRRGSLRWNEFKKLHVPLPSLEEQQAINDVLAHADKEIDLLKQQLHGLRMEKSALMQQLLTGKRRVRLPSKAEAITA